MFQLPPNKGMKVLSAAVVMAILGAYPAIAFSPDSAQFQKDMQLYKHFSRAQIKHLLDIRTAKGERIVKLKADLGAGDSVTWATLDPKKDGKEGTATETLYKELGNLKLETKKEIIVAVIDSGVDVKHADLKYNIWVNPGETGLDANGNDKATNGVDDDGDGFIDDVNGWNFLGTKKDGQIVNVPGNTLEATRQLIRLKSIPEATRSDEEKSYLAEVQAFVDKKLTDSNDPQQAQMYAALDRNATIAENAGVPRYEMLTTENIPQLIAAHPDAKAALTFLGQFVNDASEYAFSLDVCHEINEGLAKDKKYHYNEKFDSTTITGDKINELNPICKSDSVKSMSAEDAASCVTTSYGNNDVGGRDEQGHVMDSHGTHVSGIIAAIRGNSIAIDGQARNVKIMAIRAVPDGDERDKDVANAIRFAVDHGATVMNMSFGKGYSQNKTWVDDAVKYAQSKGVLLVHAAGNENSSNDEADRDLKSHASNVPNRRFYDVKGNFIGEATNWLEIGASAQTKGDHMVASFSNYGKNSVDVFAPGVKILSTFPDDNTAVEQGTSMASPEAAGVAALLRSIFPEATAEQIRKTMMDTSTKYEAVSVIKPGSEKDLVPFASLSISGGVVNAYEAALALNSTKSEQAPKSQKNVAHKNIKRQERQ